MFSPSGRAPAAKSSLLRWKMPLETSTASFLRQGPGSPRGRKRPGATLWRSSTSGAASSGSRRPASVNDGVIDAGVAIGWIRGGHRSAGKLDSLFASCRMGRKALVISTVNLAELFIHTADWTRATGGDPLAVLSASGIRVHLPDVAVARRVARLPTSLADGFAAATAQELGARLHTTDAELRERLRGFRIPITFY